MSRLIVKNIPAQFTEGQLKTHFEAIGPVTDVKIVFKGVRNRKFCFIGYKTDELAEKAIKNFNNTYVGLSKISIQPAKTLDDPDLPRPWSRYSKGSSSFNKKHGVDNERYLINNENDQNDKNIIEKPQLEENPKFQEFLELMRQKSAGTMSWTDNIDPTHDNPKERQKEIKRIAKQKAIIENQQQIQASEDTQQLIENNQQKAKSNIEGMFSGLKKELEKKKGVDSNLSFDGKRLYVTNIPFNSTEPEIRAIFEKYGTVLQLKLPRGRGGTLTGFCFVTYALSEEAARAYAELDNHIIMGRILHIRPAIGDDKPEAVETQKAIQQETSSYKRIKKSDMLSRLEDPTSWNTMFLNPNSILESISRKYGVKKREILSSEGEDIAVRVAMAETQVVKETKDWLLSVGINIDFLQKDKQNCERSKLTILIKNIQFKVTEQMIHEAFSRYGKVQRLYLSPNRSIGIIQFRDEIHAQNAFKNLSYFKFQGCYFYLEWAPKIMLNETDTKNKEPEMMNEEQEQEQDAQNNNLAKIIYVKNLNFNTTEQSLWDLFSPFNLQSVKIIYQNGLQMGYGFLEFATPDDAGKVIRQKQNCLLDEHNLQLSQSKPKPIAQNKDKKKKTQEITPTTKLVLRNIPFEATIQELRSLIKNYGELKKLRLPKKVNGQHRGFCFAEFVSLEESRNVYEALQNTHFYGRKFVIEYAAEDSEQ